MVQRDANAKLAVNQYTQIVQKYRDYPRTDEVLFFLAHNLMDLNEEKKALIAYGKLVKDYPKSRFVPDAYLAFGEYYFNNSKGPSRLAAQGRSRPTSPRPTTPRARSTASPLYKQGWCHFNLTDYPRAMDLFKATVLYGEFAGSSALEKQGGAKGKNTLIREARNDYVPCLRARRLQAGAGQGELQHRGQQPRRPLRDDGAAGEPLLRRREGPRGGAGLQLPDPREAAHREDTGLAEPRRRLRAPRGPEEADRRARSAGW
jgi:hypothetical protein